MENGCRRAQLAGQVLADSLGVGAGTCLLQGHSCDVVAPVGEQLVGGKGRRDTSELPISDQNSRQPQCAINVTLHYRGRGLQAF